MIKMSKNITFYSANKTQMQVRFMQGPAYQRKRHTNINNFLTDLKCKKQGGCRFKKTVFD